MLLPGLELATFQSWVQRSTSKVSRLPRHVCDNVASALVKPRYKHSYQKTQKQRTHTP